MSTAYVTDIVRQKNAALKEAIESSLTSDISSAFKKLGSSISQYEDQNLAQVTAERWLKLSSHE